VQNAGPAMWVQGRQFSGRIVTVTNAKIFDDPVFNYTRDFPFIWEEMRIPVSYTADRKRAEQIMLAAAGTHTRNVTELSEAALENLERRYYVTRSELEPRVFVRLTDNWVELAMRFVVPDHGARAIKDSISRDILAGFDEAKIGVASSTYDIVGLPTVRVQMTT